MQKAIIFSEKAFVQLLVTIFLATVFFGIPGLLFMLLLQWITRQSYAEESVDKHGISHVQASRLGGAAVFFCVFGLTVAAAYGGLLEVSDGPYSVFWWGWAGVLGCAALGLVEDLQNNHLSPTFRLCAKTTILALVVGLWPYLIPVNLGVPGVDALMALPLIGWALTVIFCVGFINAINMADGANGLVPGILTICFSIFYMETGGFAYASLMTSCALFTIFNVISGRLFLGDTGAYGLGAAVALSGLFLFSEEVFSASYLAVMLAYPCLDILVSLVRRRINGRSVLLPDNDHLHNRLYYHCRRWFRSKTLANSITGALIVLGTSGVAVIGYLERWWPVTSDEWAVIFVLQALAYALAFYVTGLGRSALQITVDR